MSYQEAIEKMRLIETLDKATLTLEEQEIFMSEYEEAWELVDKLNQK